MIEAIKYDNFRYYTYDDYKNWEDRWELIDGIAYAMSPAPYPKHQKIIGRIYKELDKNLECIDKNCEFYVSPIDWKINENTVVQPDVALFCEESDKQYFSKTPLIVVEVLSKSTAYKDVTTKFQLYQREGVLFYVIVEPNSEISDIFKLVGGKYELMKKATKNDKYKFEFNSDCSTQVDFGTLFD
jgi:Uma2 family endonuclease